MDFNPRAPYHALQRSAPRVTAHSSHHLRPAAFARVCAAPRSTVVELGLAEDDRRCSPADDE